MEPGLAHRPQRAGEAARVEITAADQVAGQVEHELDADAPPEIDEEVLVNADSTQIGRSPLGAAHDTEVAQQRQRGARGRGCRAALPGQVGC